MFQLSAQRHNVLLAASSPARQNGTQSSSGAWTFMAVADVLNAPGDQQELVDEANAALEHIEQVPTKWNIVIDTYAVGRNLAMVRSGSNKPIGKGYVIAFNQWVARTGFNLQKIDEATRSDMGKIIDNRADFNEWLKTLQPSQRQMWNHPRTLQRHFAAAMRGPKKTAANATKDTLKDELRKAYAELAVLRAEKEKDLRGKILLVDLDEDTVPSIVKTMMSNPKALRDPRKMADLGSELRWAARAALKRRADEINKS